MNPLKEKRTHNFEVGPHEAIVITHALAIGIKEFTRLRDMNSAQADNVLLSDTARAYGRRMADDYAKMIEAANTFASQLRKAY